MDWLASLPLDRLECVCVCVHTTRGWPTPHKGCVPEGAPPLSLSRGAGSLVSPVARATASHDAIHTHRVVPSCSTLENVPVDITFLWCHRVSRTRRTSSRTNETSLCTGDRWMDGFFHGPAHWIGGGVPLVQQCGTTGGAPTIIESVAFVEAVVA